MDSFEWNKIGGAVLATLIFVLVVKFSTEAIFEVPKPAKPGYVVEGVTEEAAAGGQAAAPVEEAMPDFGTVLPTADAAAGQATSAKCQQCHDLSKGGPDKIGPNLWGVVGRPRASRPSFSYSTAMASDHGPWTFDKLFKFLKSPGAYVPGTKMSFVGLSRPQDRINLIAWLRTQSDSPLPIPPPQPAKAAPAAAAPGGATSTSAPGGAGPGGAPAAPASATPPATPPKK